MNLSRSDFLTQSGAGGAALFGAIIRVGKRPKTKRK
jgi:hypothetical protein